MSSVNGGFPASATKASAILMPTAGSTVVVPDGASNILMWFATGLLATLSVTLPTDGGSFLGQEVQIGASGGVAILTLSAPGGTVNGALTVLAAGAVYTYVKVAANTWSRKL